MLNSNTDLLYNYNCLNHPLIPFEMTCTFTLWNAKLHFHSIATASLGLCEVDSDTESDDSAFGPDLDEWKS